MRLASFAPIPAAIAAAPPAPSKELDDAVMHLDWAHEIAGSAVSEPSGVSITELLGASGDAAKAAELLTSIQQPIGAEHAREAASALETAALALRDEDPDVAAGVVQARGEDAEQAIHDAFTAIGMDGRGE